MASPTVEIQPSMIQLVDDVIYEAIQKKASDIHWEPFSEFLRLRFRCDGFLREIRQLPKSWIPPVISRIKVLASLDIAEKRLPQDGHFNWSFENRLIDCRVSTCPTLYGEKIVIRLLEGQAHAFQIKDLGMSETHETMFLRAITQPQGLILVTGPTGSGKTITLYTALYLLNEIYRNISTIEDPVEIKLHGINQVYVNPKIGFDFSMALRSFLRQDPDVLMVGEIRDIETADIAIRAAQTGHLLLSTLHTNSAAETLHRLLNMGIPFHYLAHCLLLIVAQRLVRKLCLFCRIPMESCEPLLKDKQIYRANTAGCPHCYEGYNGRVALYEMIPFDAQTKELLLKHQSLEPLTKEPSFISLKRAGLLSVSLGETSLEELHRITLYEKN